jgi:hypothetical protein
MPNDTVPPLLIITATYWHKIPNTYANNFLLAWITIGGATKCGLFKVTVRSCWTLDDYDIDSWALTTEEKCEFCMQFISGHFFLLTYRQKFTCMNFVRSIIEILKVIKAAIAYSYHQSLAFYWATTVNLIMCWADFLKTQPVHRSLNRPNAEQRCS